MLGAPPGFIPIKGDIVNARQISSVSVIKTTVSSTHQYLIIHEDLKLDWNKEIICVECDKVKWYLNMSVQQFAAQIVEAMSEVT